MIRYWGTPVIAALLCAGSICGSTLYTNSAAFSTALSSEPQQIEDFGGLASGQIINAGSKVDGITYTFINSGMAIITPNYSSMSSNGLSLGGYNSGTGADYFMAGDAVTLTFSHPVNAIGVFFNTSAYTGNIAMYQVSAGGLTATTGAEVFDTNTFVFAGLMSDAYFTTATFSGTDFFTIPEIVSATTPEPGSLFLLITGAAVVWIEFGRRRRSPNYMRCL